MYEDGAQICLLCFPSKVNFIWDPRNDGFPPNFETLYPSFSRYTGAHAVNVVKTLACLNRAFFIPIRVFVFFFYILEI